tara:strand:- start:83 stop:364 length:282 start_codon:yes stop_codon:yes gene_type:complete
MWGPRYSFKIDSLSPEDGYGWVLRYFQGDVEISGYEIFSAPVGIAWMIQQEEFGNAKFTGERWVDKLASDHLNNMGNKSQYEPGIEQIKLCLE